MLKVQALTFALKLKENGLFGILVKKFVLGNTARELAPSKQSFEDVKRSLVQVDSLKRIVK